MGVEHQEGKHQQNGGRESPVVVLGGKLDPGVDQEEVHLNLDIGQGSVSGGMQLDKMLELAGFDWDIPHPLQLRRLGGNAGLQHCRREAGLIEALNSLDTCKQQVVLED